MKTLKCLFALMMCIAMLGSYVLASEVLTAKDEFTFDGKSLAEFANVDGAPVIEGKSAYAINLNTGTVVFEKNSDDLVYPASTTKLMTAIVAYENIEDLDVMITASEESVKKTQGANVRIEQGESYSARELLYALLISGTFRPDFRAA